MYLTILITIFFVCTGTILWRNYTFVTVHRTSKKNRREWREDLTGLVFARATEDDIDTGVWICTSPRPHAATSLQHAQERMPKLLRGWTWNSNNSKYTTIIMKRSRYKKLVRAAIDGAMDKRPQYA